MAHARRPICSHSTFDPVEDEVPTSESRSTGPLESALSEGKATPPTAKYTKLTKTDTAATKAASLHRQLAGDACSLLRPMALSINVNVALQASHADSRSCNLVCRQPTSTAKEAQKKNRIQNRTHAKPESGVSFRHHVQNRACSPPAVETLGPARMLKFEPQTLEKLKSWDLQPQNHDAKQAAASSRPARRLRRLCRLFLKHS